MVATKKLHGSQRGLVWMETGEQWSHVCSHAQTSPHQVDQYTWFCDWKLNFYQILMGRKKIMFHIFFCGCLKDEEHSWAYVQQWGRQSKDWKQFCLIEIPGLGGGSPPLLTRPLTSIYSECIPVPPSQHSTYIFPSNWYFQYDIFSLGLLFCWLSHLNSPRLVRQIRIVLKKSGSLLNFAKACSTKQDGSGKG